MRTDARGTPSVDELIARAWALRQRKKAIEEELRAANDALLHAMGQRDRVEHGRLIATRTGRPEGLRVVAAGAVPARWCVSKPDMKRLNAHYQETGEVVPGTEVAAARRWLAMRERQE